MIRNYLLLLVLLPCIAYCAISLNDSPITHGSISVNGSPLQYQFTIPSGASSLQLTLIPCSGLFSWQVGTDLNNLTVACTSTSSLTNCRYEYDTIPSGTVVYTIITPQQGFGASFDIVASTDLTFFDAINPSTSASSLSVVAVQTPVLGSNYLVKISYPYIYAPSGTFNTYTVYQIMSSGSFPDDPSVNNHTACGVKNYLTQSTANYTYLDTEIDSYLSVDPTKYTFITVVVDRQNSTYTYSSAFSGVTISPVFSSPTTASTVSGSTTSGSTSDSSASSTSGSVTGLIVSGSTTSSGSVSSTTSNENQSTTSGNQNPTGSTSGSVSGSGSTSGAVSGGSTTGSASGSTITTGNNARGTTTSGRTVSSSTTTASVPFNDSSKLQYSIATILSLILLVVAIL